MKKETINSKTGVFDSKKGGPHLFALNRSRVLFSEGELGDGDVIENNVEVTCALGEFASNHEADLRALSDELRSVEFSHDALEDLKTV